MLEGPIPFFFFFLPCSRPFEFLVFSKLSVTEHEPQIFNAFHFCLILPHQINVAMSFFHLKYANAQSKILNLDVRSSILVDYVFRELVLNQCTEYIQTKSTTVAHSIEETRLNLNHLKQIITDISTSAETATTAEGDVSSSSSDNSSSTGFETPEEMTAKVTQLEELLKTLEYQQEALKEARQKIDGAVLEELDMCDSTGTPLGLSTEAGSSSAADILESRGTYTLCRKMEGQAIQLSFAVPPDGAINLDTLLGEGRIKVSKDKHNKGRGKHRRSSSSRPSSKGKGKKRGGLQDITNQSGSGHRRSMTTAQ